MKILKLILLQCVMAAFALSPAATFASSPAQIRPVKYVFLFIGDGMSIPQRMMTEEFLRLSGKGGLFINAMPNNAITYTRSNNSFITDSAASGTAIACGAKTDNGKIGVCPKLNPLESIAKVAKKSGRKVGIITSVTINHATPAAFYANNENRGNYYEIALDMVSSEFDFFGGGGIAKNDDRKSKSYKGDAYELARKAGYKVLLKDDSAVRALHADGSKVMAFGSDEALPYAIDDNSGLRISDYLSKAIELLDNSRGFFIMVEGGKIDWMCHANDAATVMREVVDFDKSVRVAGEFAKKHPGETLIVVTGDHETGGLTLGFAGTGYKSYIQLLENQKCSREKLAEMLGNMRSENPDMKFDDVKPFVTKYMGLRFDGPKDDRMRLSADEEKLIRESFEKNMLNPKNKKGALSFAITLTNCLDNKAALAWTSGSHTALPVSTTAIGAGSSLFNGTLDNTDISKILKQAVK